MKAFPRWRKIALRNRRRFAGFAVALIFALWCHSGIGQSVTATVTGVVTDNQNAAIAGASVVMTNTTTGVTTATKSNGDGLYSLPNLPTGVYSLRVERAGFKRYDHPGITLTTGQVLGMDITLAVGSSTETVEVTGIPPQLETETSDVDQLLESKSIEDLPLGNRQTFNIMNLMPAAVWTGYDANGEPSVSTAGSRMESQMLWIDGADEENIRLGVSNANWDPPIDAVEEITVISNNYAAEYGGTSGGVIMETTKSGTNQLHGSVSEYVRNDDFDAPGYFAPLVNGAKSTPELRYNVFDATIGGPIRRNKTFFFFAYQGQREVTGSTTTLTVPSLLQRAGDFSQTYTTSGALIPIYDPFSNVTVGGVTTRTQYPGNIITSIDPVAANILNYYPLPNKAATNAAGASNFSGNENLNFTDNFYMAKVDHSFNDLNKLTVRYVFAGYFNTLKSVYPDNAAGDPKQFPILNNNSYYGDYTRILSPTIVNDFRYDYSTRYYNNVSEGLNQGYAAKVGLNGLSDIAFPEIVVSGFGTLGNATQSRIQTPDSSWAVVDDLSIVRGKHSLKMGYEARHSRDREFDNFVASGAFTFSPLETDKPGNTTTGSALASLEAGVPNAYSQSQTEMLDRHSMYYAAFVQDDWTMSQSLTLNVGLRWEVDTPMADNNNRMNGFDPNETNPVSGTPGVVKFMGVNGWRTNAYNEDWVNFGPRLGFAWKPFASPDTVVRGGFGIFYGSAFDAAEPTAATLGFGSQASVSSPNNGLTFPWTLSTFPAPPATIPPLNDSFGAVPVGSTVSTTPTYFDPNRRRGYVYEFNMGVQRQLTPTLAITVEGLATLGRKLPNTNLPLGQISPSVLSATQDTQIYRPFPQFNGVTLLSPTNGTSNYYAGVIQAEKRVSHGLNFTASYTWSKFLDDTFEGGGTNLGVVTGPYQNLYNRRADYGYSANDAPSRFNFGGVYELPFGAGQKWFNSHRAVDYLMGGWGISPLTLLQSGGTTTAVTTTNNSDAFSAGSQRPNLLHSPRLSHRTPGEWFDTTAFAQPAVLTFGNEGVGIIRCPGLIEQDISVLRNFHLGEKAQLQFRGEFFNVLNHTNFSVPGSTFGTSSFGVISSANAGRVIEAGGHITF